MVVVGMLLGDLVIRRVCTDLPAFQSRSGDYLVVGLCIMLGLIGFSMGLDGSIARILRNAGLGVILVPIFAVLGTLGVAPGAVDRHRVFWRTPAGVFSVSLPINGEPATLANGGTIGFACQSPEQAQAWHAAGVANGGSTCEDPPGVRDSGAVKLYLAYLRDPDGNKLCGLHRL